MGTNEVSSQSVVKGRKMQIDRRQLKACWVTVPPNLNTRYAGLYCLFLKILFHTTMGRKEEKAKGLMAFPSPTRTLQSKLECGFNFAIKKSSLRRFQYHLHPSFFNCNNHNSFSNSKTVLFWTSTPCPVLKLHISRSQFRVQSWNYTFLYLSSESSSETTHLKRTSEKISSSM